MVALRTLDGELGGSPFLFVAAIVSCFNGAKVRVWAVVWVVFGAGRCGGFLRLAEIVYLWNCSYELSPF